VNKLAIAQRVQQETTGYSARNKITTTVLDDGAPVKTKQIVGAVEQADKLLQEERLWDWRFVDRATIITTTDDTGDYRIEVGSGEGARQVLDFMPGAFYLRRADSTGAWMPLIEHGYATWLDLYGRVYETLAPSQPIIITQLRNKQLRLTPRPSADTSYAVMASYWSPPVLMAEDGDEPGFDQDLHEVLVWRACDYLIGELDLSAGVQLRIAKNLQKYEMRLASRYLA
jgi:hypothetical protein